ncbi:MAG: tetratricopeptide repeat protein [Candidatus Binatia bacterium]
MSLIADALKKAQSTRLGRRYLAGEPAGVLPVAREGYAGGQSGLGAALSRIQVSPTLLIGLGAGVVVFVVLVTYVFYGRSPRGKSQAAPSQVAVQKGLILTAPPTAPAVEPLSLEKESGPSGESARQEERKGRSSDPAPGTMETAKSTSQPATAKAQVERKADESTNRKEGSKVSVAPDLTEEVRYHFNLALFYQEEKNFVQARREYEKVVQAWPLYTEAHNNLGVVYKELGMYEQGISEIKKALSLNPRYTRAYHNLGVIYQLKGDFRQATKNYEIALSFDHKHISSYNNLGLVYRAEKRPHEARDVLEKALAIDASISQTHYNLALVLEELGEIERARLHFQKFIDLSGEANGALAERVRAHLQGLVARK